jgi:biotin-(acetyl-CoA carboxylase) ligase
MAEAAEAISELPEGAIGLKWPNDLVAPTFDAWPKLAGVLGETDGLGTDDPRVIVGIGVNTNWHVADFPPELSMTSLRQMSGRATDPDALIAAFLRRLEPLLDALRDGSFAADPWARRQVTTSTQIHVIEHDGTDRSLRAVGVDPETGALLVVDDGIGSAVHVGEIAHVRV